MNQSPVCVDESRRAKENSRFRSGSGTNDSLCMDLGLCCLEAELSVSPSAWLKINRYAPFTLTRSRFLLHFKTTSKHYPLTSLKQGKRILHEKSISYNHILQKKQMQKNNHVAVSRIPSNLLS